MKNIIFTLIVASNFCFSQTQSKMNQDADANYKKADKELNLVYNKILNDYKDDKIFIAKFKAAQNAWIKFRDAEMNALFPEEDKKTQYGSVFPMCWSNALTDLTKQRIMKLKVWLNGIEEGDACAGSVKIKE
ncbi:MAG: DUF1311 domain-containing protein [Saprospiraceae bacterium]|nr:DUF1311 domain-containing protein [Saprospiraceae bacterium]MBX7176764.1 DUF1311 domain-containing protein [Saprospiraceae bacterium]HMW39466.1 DUF1311 domain-containing protein [Saprospiraceae bacterium]HMX88313.1 DUF1311 domain-containing protein [Saprospiraceae bacterium]HMZ40403.1 DUF1311 domain-containing protein [Saprospiraceae bacterium]